MIKYKEIKMLIFNKIKKSFKKKILKINKI